MNLQLFRNALTLFGVYLFLFTCLALLGITEGEESSTNTEENKTIFSQTSATYSKQTVCGVKPTNDVEALTSNHARQEKFQSDSPWNVAIFRKRDKLMICDGTIITEFLIVSAAHCFYNTTTDKLNSIENYEVMVSKYTRNYTIDDNRYTKVYQLTKLTQAPGGYYGANDAYSNDIILLETKEKIVFNPYVVPACVQWTMCMSRFNPPEGAVGKVVSTRKETLNDLTSGILKATDIPYLQSCKDKVSAHLRRFIPFDKFCGDNLNGTALKRGDAGAGWLVPAEPNNSYYLHGVLSTYLGKSNNYYITTFADIVLHLEWINSIKSSIEKRILNEQANLGVQLR